MNAQAEPADDWPRYRFSSEETERLRAAGMAKDARPFTLDDVFEMMRIGALDPDAKVELIDGELVEMSPQNTPHMEAKRILLTRLVRELGDGVAVHVEGTLRLAPRTAPSPDLFIHSVSLKPDKVRGTDVLLLIEVADSSLLRDLRSKASLYARFGVPDYWVVDTVGRRLFVHRVPVEGAYREVTEIARGDAVEPLAFPGFNFAANEIPAGVS